MKKELSARCNHFFKLFCEEQGKPVKELTDSGMSVITEYNWPGNVRELRNVIEKIVTLVDKSKLEKADIFPLLKGNTAMAFEMPQSISFKDAKRNFERKILLDKLNEFEWNITQTAVALQMPRTYLYKKMKNLGIEC